MNHVLWKYFYLNYGLIVDYQLAKSDINSGFGLGIGLGFGAKYNYKNFFFYINPKWERHLFLSKKDGLIELGLMLGLGYSF